MNTAVGEFNSMPASDPPHRDVPSDIMTTLHRPLLDQPEPDWAAALVYFLSPNASHGMENLQDLYLFLTRVVHPNLIVRNRHYLQDMYTAMPHLSIRMGLRYDEFDMTPESQVEIADIPVGISPSNPRRPNLPLDAITNIPQRSIFRAYPTPDGDRLLQILISGEIEVFQNIRNLLRLGHRPSEVDNHMTVAEAVVRRWNMGRLIQMVIRALEIFWYLAHCNDTLERFRKIGWRGIEQFNLAPDASNDKKDPRRDGGGKGGRTTWR